jgi:hypothetical protein
MGRTLLLTWNTVNEKVYLQIHFIGFPVATAL